MSVRQLTPGITDTKNNILNYDLFKKFNLKIHKESLKMRNKIISFKKKKR